MTQFSSPLLCDKALKNHKHVCAIFNSRAEARDVIGEFIAEGCKKGQKTMMLLDPDMVEDATRNLRESGVDVDGVSASKIFELKTWHDSYLKDGKFNGESVLEYVSELMKEARADGHETVWITGDMNWAGRNPLESAELVAYECRLNEVKPEFADDVWVCFYDASQFSGNVISDIIRAHPVVLMGNKLFENPFYTPPAELLKELSDWKFVKPVQKPKSKPTTIYSD